jgi:hypothetical protein
MNPVYLLGGFYGLVPRVWWAGKPSYVGSGPIAGALVFREEAYVTRGAGIPISMPSEFALAFGLSGFWIGLMLYFFLAILSYLAMRRYPLYFAPIVLFAFQLTGGGFPKSMSVLFMNIIGVFFVSRLLNFRVVRVKNSVARPHRFNMRDAGNLTDLT